MIPAEVLAYGQETVVRLRRLLPEDFVGAYFIGSIALGGYVAGESDIDIIAVTGVRPSAGDKAQIVADLSHPNLPCPTRGLEFVLYERSQIEASASTTTFELNLNTGPRMISHAGFDASREPRFWFVIDRAIAHRSGVTIEGPPAADLFAPIPRPAVLESLMESTAWHRVHDGPGANAVLNACRAWRYADEDILGSKVEAAVWARPRWGDGAIIEAAVRSRRGEPAQLAEGRIRALVDHVREILASHLPESGNAGGSCGV